jgi:mannose-6-phosphate isomerase-like protein (cupin superfamily)
MEPRVALTVERSGGGHVAARGEGRELFIGTLQVSAEQSAALLRSSLCPLVPQGRGAPPHVHPHRYELFYIVKGRLTFVLGTREFEVEQGGTVFVPRGTRSNPSPIRKPS